MYNPLPPLIFLSILVFVSLPLLILATITTTLAVTTLLLRASLVYIDLGLALITTHILPCSPAPTVPRSKTLLPSPSSPQDPINPQAPPTRILRRRRQSSSSGGSSGIYLSAQNPNHSPTSSSSSATPRRASSGIFGLGALGPLRDFEGVGGWRFTTLAEDARDDEVWMSLNSRLQLPVLGATGAAGSAQAMGKAPASTGAKDSQGTAKKKHRRNATGGSLPGRGTGNGLGMRPATPEDLGMAPLVRGDRTPDELSVEEGFFGKKRNEDLRAAIMGAGPEGSPLGGWSGRNSGIN
ncbi:MAG: hypothetical protein M1814_002773 [Vezdaea aestivalis]|nr:MAG: hypothetical protein M1814_002773 [Vezdaea aestivalis]